MDNIFEYDFELINRETNESVIIGELVQADNVPINREHKPIRKIIVGYEMLKTIKIGDKVKIEIVINENDFSIEGNIVSMDDCILSIQ